MYYICTRNKELIGLWCNGNTTVFGAVVLGSSPSGPTEKPLRNERLSFFIKGMSWHKKSGSFEPLFVFIEVRLDLKSNNRSHCVVN